MRLALGSLISSNQTVAGAVAKVAAICFHSAAKRIAWASGAAISSS